jgi:hypothetical protein
MAKLRVEISDRAKLAATEHAERQELAHILGNIAQALGAGTTTSGDIKDRAGAIVGEWSYSNG